MDPARAERFRTRLEARAAELRAGLERSSDQTAAVKPDPAIGRLTRVDAVQAGYVSEAVRRQMKMELDRIERALRAIEEGTYGVCRDCGKALSDARLDARPDASLCVECASKRER
jgi:DnaK suppressor protein